MKRGAIAFLVIGILPGCMTTPDKIEKAAEQIIEKAQGVQGHCDQALSRLDTGGDVRPPINAAKAKAAEIEALATKVPELVDKGREELVKAKSKTSLWLVLGLAGIGVAFVVAAVFCSMKGKFNGVAVFGVCGPLFLGLAAKPVLLKWGLGIAVAILAGGLGYALWKAGVLGDMVDWLTEWRDRIVRGVELAKKDNPGAVKVVTDRIATENQQTGGQLRTEVDLARVEMRATGQLPP